MKAFNYKNLYSSNVGKIRNTFVYDYMFLVIKIHSKFKIYLLAFFTAVLNAFKIYLLNF